jgi:spore germination protein (amino acid permease)
MYQPGKMGIAEGIALVFIITFVPVFQTIWSTTVDRAQGAAWAIPLISGTTTLGILFAVLWIMRRHPGDLLQIAEQLVGKAGAFLIGMHYMVHFMTEAVFLTREFAENTLITALPNAEFAITILFFATIPTILIFLGIETIARIAYLFLPFLIFSVLVVIFLIRQKFIFYQLAPWQGPGVIKVLQNGLQVTGFNFGVLLLPFLRHSFQDIPTIRKIGIYGFGLSIFLRFIMIASYLMVFGVMVAREKVLPFFEMTRIAYVSRYLQHIEALFILVWVMAGLSAIAVSLYISLYLGVRLFKLPTMKPLIIPFALIMSQLAMLQSDISSVIELHSKLIMTVYNMGTAGIPLVLVFVSIIRGRRKKTCKIRGA